MLSQFINELPIWALPRETVRARTVLMGSTQPTMSQIYSMKVVAGAGLNFDRTTLLGYTEHV